MSVRGTTEMQLAVCESNIFLKYYGTPPSTLGGLPREINSCWKAWKISAKSDANQMQQRRIAIVALRRLMGWGADDTSAEAAMPGSCSDRGPCLIMHMIKPLIYDRFEVIIGKSENVYDRKCQEFP